ncbi:MAG: cation:proton antiporter [Clostridiales bacterium]|nr:cation:proton antiporter [Clostridiales bacterium]
MHIPALISDLALMLIVAGITTILFVKIKQPLVLGYILAGFLTGPYFKLFPAVHDMVNINTWGEMGIIFLMFSLGLEFNLHKLASVGGTAIITALTEIGGMLGLGFVLGRLMGWGMMDSIFLGGVLSMSSTLIILKTFEELKLKGKKFTELVFGTLIIEDIAGIFMMIILSTIAVSSGVSGGELTQKLLLMLLYLALWLMLGIYLIPTLLKKIHNIATDEMLLIVSLGMCLGMVLLANALGFSSALGAFLAGSLLAGTIHAERVEHLSKPVKDLFGAVFFISVGMLVDPAVLLQYKLPVFYVALTTLIGQMFFSSCGMLLSGQRLNTALSCGFSLAQIGEFSFIITALGASLKVTSDFLYPIVVCVSVITTLTTPFTIRMATPFYNFLNSHLPQPWLSKLNRYTSAAQSEQEQDSEWQQFIRNYFSRLAIYVVLILGLIYVGLQFLFPFACGYMGDTGARLLTAALILILTAPFMRPLLSLRNRYFASLWLKSRSNHPPLIVLALIKLVIAMVLIMLPVQQLYHIPLLMLVGITLVLTVLIYRSDWLFSSYLQVEARFLSNFNERHLAVSAGNAPDHRWLDKHVWVCHIPDFSRETYLDKTLLQLRWGERFGINVVKIIRGKRHINIPAGTERVRAGDDLYLMGGKDRLDLLLRELGLPSSADGEIYPTLHDFIEKAQDGFAEEDQLLCYTVTAERGMKITGLSIKDAKLKEKWSCFVIGLERDLYPLIFPSHNMVINNRDLIWVLGTQKMAGKLARADLLELPDEEAEEAIEQG